MLVMLLNGAGCTMKTAPRVDSIRRILQMRYTFDLDVRLQWQLFDSDAGTTLGLVSSGIDDVDLCLVTGFGRSKKVS